MHRIMKTTKPLYADLMAKYIFGTEENFKFGSHILELFFDLKPGTLDKAIIKNNVHLSPKTISKKGFEMDIMVEIPSLEVVNVEFYSKYDRNSEIKSFMYITNKFSNSLNVGEGYSTAKKISQINFVKNNSMHSTGKVISEYLVANKDNTEDKVLPDLFQLFIVDLDQEINTDYNNNELMRWIKLIGAETDEEMQEIVKGNEMMEEVYEKMKEFSQEEWVDDYFSKERLIKSQHSSEMQEQKERLTEEFNEKDRLLRSQFDSELKEQKQRLTEEFNEKDRLLRSQFDSELKEQEEKMTEEFNTQKDKLAEEFNEKDRLLRSQHHSEMQEQKERLTEEFNEKDRLLRSQFDSELKEQKEKLTDKLTKKLNSEKEQEITKMIENMILKKYQLEDIAEITNVPLNKVKDIKKKMKAS